MSKSLAVPVAPEKETMLNRDPPIWYERRGFVRGGVGQVSIASVTTDRAGVAGIPSTLAARKKMSPAPLSAS